MTGTKDFYEQLCGNSLGDRTSILIHRCFPADFHGYDGISLKYIPYYTYITSQVFNAGKKSATFNANDKILHINPVLNDLKIINAVSINARRAIRVNNMSSYLCVIR